MHAPDAPQPMATATYGRIPSYRDSRREVWGFALSPPEAFFGHATTYTCPRRSARRVAAELAAQAAERGYRLEVVGLP